MIFGAPTPYTLRRLFANALPDWRADYTASALTPIFPRRQPGARRRRD